MLPSAKANADTTLPSQTGSIIVHLYQTSLGGGEPGTGGEDAVLPADAKPIAGIPFALAKLSDDPTAANGFDPPITIDSPPLGSFTPRKGTTDMQGAISFDDLERGVYVLTQAAAEGYRPAQHKLLVAVPMSGVTGSELRWNVHVYPKSYPVDAISKIAEEPQTVFGVGDEARWRIAVPVPTTLKQPNQDGTFSYGRSWQIRDLPDERLDVIEGARIELLNEAGAPAGVVLVLGVDVIESSDATTHRITWAITDEALRRIVDSDAAELVIELATRLNESAYGSTSDIYNNAQVSYVSASGDELTHAVIPASGPDAGNPAHPRIHTGGLIIDKRLTSTGMKLSGAVFKVARTRDDALRGRFLTKTLDGDAQDIELVTDANGAAVLGGLRPGTYWLNEVQAPSFPDGRGKQIACIRLVEPAEVQVGDRIQQALAAVAVDNRAATPTDEAAAALTSALVRTGDVGWFALIALVLAVVLAGGYAHRHARSDDDAHDGEEGSRP